MNYYENDDDTNLDEEEMIGAFDENYDHNQQHITEAAKFKNKFNDSEDDHADLILNGNANNKVTNNPMHVMHKVYLTEEDQENLDPDDQMQINNFFQLNEEKANLLKVLHEYSGVKRPAKVHHKNISKYVKRHKRDHSVK